MQLIANTSVSNSQGIYFPNLYTPISGKTLSDLLYCQCDRDYQCFLSTDFLRFQVTVTSGNPSVAINGQVFSATTSLNGRYNFNIPLTNFEGALIQVELFNNPIVGSTFVDKSNVIKVLAPEDECRTLLLEWRSECEAHGVDYTLDAGFLNCLRVPMRYFRPAASDNETLNVTKGPDGKYRFCSSDIDEVWTFAVSDIPDWMHQTIRKAYLNSTFRINGTEFIRNVGFRKTERRCCNYQGEATFIPQDSDNAVANCCIGDPLEFVPVPLAVIDCSETPTVSDYVIDLTNSTDGEGSTITSSSTDIKYVFDFAGKYFAEIPASGDPTDPGDWTLVFSPQGTNATFITDVVNNISLPSGGFAGYFELSEDFLLDCGLQVASISVIIVEDGVASTNAVCTLTADSSGSLDCPTASLASSNSTDNNAVSISNAGSTDSNGLPIEGNPGYSFSHVFKQGPCPGTATLPFFTVSGLGGSTALNFSSWHPALSPTALQALIIAEFSGGMGAPGYMFDKEAVVLLMAQAGFLPGGDWCIESTVTNLTTSCADSTTLDIPGELILFQYANHSEGYSPTLMNNTRTGLGNYFDETGMYNLATVASQLSSNTYWIEGSFGPNLAVGNQTTLQSTGAFVSDFFNYTTTDKVYHSQLMENNSGLQSYSNAYFVFDTPDTSFVRTWFVASPPIGITGGGGGAIVREFFETGGTGGISGETILSVAQEVMRFPLGGGGIVMSGSDDPCAGTANPQRADISAGGTAHPFTATGVDGLTVVVNSLVQGTYYVKYRAITVGGLVLESISSFTMFEV